PAVQARGLARAGHLARGARRLLERHGDVGDQIPGVAAGAPRAQPALRGRAGAAARRTDALHGVPRSGLRRRAVAGAGQQDPGPAPLQLAEPAGCAARPPDRRLQSGPAAAGVRLESVFAQSAQPSPAEASFAKALISPGTGRSPWSISA